MSTPLSPLTTSRQNSRALSSEYDGVIETPLLSPRKLVGDGRRDSSFGYDATEYETQGPEIYNEDAESYQETPSSPFRYDGRDDTVDQKMLRLRQASLGMSERSATPRKRSYEQVPDFHDLEEEIDDRYKKGMGRRDVPDIHVFADEDSEFSQYNRSVGARSMVEEQNNEGMSTVLRESNEEATSGSKENLDSHDDADDDMIDYSHDLMDDTCLSTFSAVPNVDMTAFANLHGESPLKSPRPLPSCPGRDDDDDTQRQDLEAGTPITAKRSPRKNALIDMSSPISPIPRKRDFGDHEDTREASNLLDFTDQSNFFPRRQRYSLQPNERYSPSRRSPLRNLRESIRSPAKVSLLDFDIPSAPTPRSIPTITPRELESLKSGFLSEISSLKATLSGKEAEVSSLKQAVADAERRVGEALEEVRNEASRKEALEIDQAEWQRRGREMEEVLRSVKADIFEGERERERLTKKIEESDRGKEQLEGRIVELETQLTAARKSAAGEHGPSGNAPPTKTAEETANEVQDAVEKVARELHTLYKNKHETKVAALKKSYEARWEKRVREAENKAKAANEENERLRSERDSVMENARPDSSMIVHEKEEHEAEKRVLEAQIKGLQQEMVALKKDSEQLRAELKVERAEKGELVAAVDEWLAIQQNPPQQQQPSNFSSPKSQTPEPLPQDIELLADEEPEQDIIRSNPPITRGPSSSSSASNGERRIPKIPAPAVRHARGNSGSRSGIAVFTPGRSGIMGSIERMGRGV
ncbi:hypothetical protein P175DRAFT_0496928 [Aspergillus ochraceoroseus IBT 24754]|uniref:Uncharacterized protein n=2 Tax=Aspergillus ochraceoroseus TaxID=138278 RepID=A0A2T5M5I8_9EURO|nr:uncharacterized protein P175DRAFT_0496928 [Aspergillus ochraceoroseus IBT 24754]KKK18618.1 hypothetical protein AOCH_006377 [Aspergillus ochraceoroseus]PTU23797.1 hypothetical protein P175DRAFT_0496928 [Aspergillus ochraceoroseus IBT 24754]